MRHSLARIQDNLVVARGQAFAVYRLRGGAAPESITALAEAAQSSFSLLRIPREWSFDEYAIGTEAAADVRHAHTERLCAYIDAQRRSLDGRLAAGPPELYLSVRLPARRTRAELTEVERAMWGRLYSSCERVSEHRLRWLTRRALCRGLPHAAASDAKYAYSIEATRDLLRVRSRLGVSHQTFLEVDPLSPGADTGSRPGEGPPNSLDVATWVPDLALSVRGGASAGASPVLATASLAVGAPSVAELERRVDLLRHELGSTSLHRPLGEQRTLFFDHLPGEAARSLARSRGVDPERLRPILVPGDAALGTRAGPYVGHRLEGPARAVLFDPREVARSGRRLVLVTGAKRSGKTPFVQLLMHQAFLTGSTVVGVDPGGEHVLHRLPSVRAHARVVELSDEPYLSGFLDPMRIAPPALRQQFAGALLLDVLGGESDPETAREVRLAVRTVAARRGRLGDVVAELRRGRGAGREAAEQLAACAENGLAGLLFGEAGIDPPEPIPPQLTELRVPRLAVAEEASEGDLRLRRALLQMLALYGLRLAARDARRESVLGLDAATELLADASGRELVRHIARVAQARSVTPLLATRSLAGAEELADAVAAQLSFRAGSRQEATRALRLLGLDDEEPSLRRALSSAERGRCLMRDQSGRTGLVQIELLDPELTDALQETPVMSQQRGGAPTASLNGRCT